MTKSQKRMLDKLRTMKPEDLTEEDQEDLEELEQLEADEQKQDQKSDDPLNSINQSLEEIKKWLKPQETKTQEKVEIPTPQPVITNQDLEDQDQKPQESKMKKLFKALW